LNKNILFIFLFLISITLISASNEFGYNYIEQQKGNITTINNQTYNIVQNNYQINQTNNITNNITTFVTNNTYYNTTNNISNNFYSTIGVNLTQMDNSTIITIKESWIDSLWVRITNLPSLVISLVGNWSNDKINYYIKGETYNKSEVDNNLSNYYLNSNPNNYINSSSNNSYYLSTNPSGYFNSSNYYSYNATYASYSSINTTANIQQLLGGTNISQYAYNQTIPANSYTDARITAVNSTGQLALAINSTAQQALTINTTQNIQNLYFYNKSEVNNLIPSFLTYYFWDTNSSVNATYKIMNTSQNPTITSYNVSGLTDGTAIVWRLNKDTNLTSLSAGYLHIHTTATKLGGSGALQIYGQLFKRYLNGSLVLIATTDTSQELVTGDPTQINLFASIPQTTLNITDMLLWRLVSQVGGGSAPSVSIAVGGTTNNGLDLPVTFSSFTELEPVSIHRDGTTPLTNNWNVGGFNITNLSIQGNTLNFTTAWINNINISTWILNISKNWTLDTFNNWNSTWDNRGLIVDLNNSLFNSAPWNQSGTNVILNKIGSNVGIGTTTPSKTLDVNAGTINSGYIQITGNSSGIIFNSSDIIASKRWDITNTLGDLRFTETGVAVRMIIQNTTGNAGIGTTSPTDKLTISGTSPQLGINSLNSVDAQFRFYNASTLSSIIYRPGNTNDLRFYVGGGDRMTINSSTGNIGIGTTNPVSPGGYGKTLAIEGTYASLLLNSTTPGKAYEIGVSSKGSIDFASGTTALMTINASGNVGIGTISPSMQLEVAGNTTVREMINLQVRTLPTCATLYNGSIMRNTTGVYGCSSTKNWVFLF